MKKLLDVGGGNKNIAVFPEAFGDVEHVLLDIDPGVNPDVLCDGRELHTLPPEQYDIIWCSHNLEHYLSSDIPDVLRGFWHLLKRGGLVYIAVPNLLEVFRTMLLGGHDIIDIAYTTQDLHVSYADMIYGSHQIMCDGNKYYHHNYGFTAKSLSHIMGCFGFVEVSLVEEGFNLIYMGVKK
jgi:SAM-dependent methyltransferase